jgi:hypothetical protein
MALLTSVYERESECDVGLPPRVQRLRRLHHYGAGFPSPRLHEKRDRARFGQLHRIVKASSLNAFVHLSITSAEPSPTYTFCVSFFLQTPCTASIADCFHELVDRAMQRLTSCARAQCCQILAMKALCAARAFNIDERLNVEQHTRRS